ncbi:MAG: serine protease [Planctomycetes bacterium]|nr:serine protease [Planctomycetota bacterium]
MTADQQFEQRLLALDHRLAAVQSQSEIINVFRNIEERAAPCVFLLHCTFDYRVVGGTPGDLETGTGWGSGFMISPDGHLVTNKHVLQPWKFDPDLASMLASKEIELVGPSRIYAWACGERCVSEAGVPLLSRAFSTTGPRKLRIAGFAPDALRPIERDTLGRITEPPLHELDNNDLALLQLEGGPYPCLALAAPGRVRKLDRVMTLGYPRGQRGLECGIAQTSPSLGTVRKAEDTIHITASIIPGNSGGPLMDERGEVIGVVTRIYSETLGICLRADLVRDFLQRTLSATGTPPQPGNAVITTRQSFYR